MCMYYALEGYALVRTLGNSKKESVRCSCGRFVVIHWNSSNTVDGP